MTDLLTRARKRRDRMWKDTPDIDLLTDLIDALAVDRLEAATKDDAL